MHYNGANGYLFVNGLEIIKVKVKYSAIVATPLCLGNTSKDISVDDVKKAGVDDILETHEYLMKTHDKK